MHYKLIIHDNKPWIYRDMAYQIMEQVRAGGHTSEIVTHEADKNTDDTQYVFLGTNYAQFYVPPGSIVTNFDFYEQLFKILTPEIIETCIIWDYSQENIDILLDKYPKSQCYLFHMGYAPMLDFGLQYDEQDKDIDVLFLGGLTTRRSYIIDQLKENGCKVVQEYNKSGPDRADLFKRAKVVLSLYSYDWQHTISGSRLAPSLCCNAFVVSENCSNVDQNNRWKEYVVSVDYDELVPTIMRYLADPQARKTFADQAYIAFKKTRSCAIPAKLYRVLVTGGTGMVGKALQLHTKRDTRYTYVGSKDADLSDLAQTKALFDRVRPDAVIHLAAIVGGLFYNIENNARMLDLNTRININVARCSVESGVRKVIMVNSTCAFPAESDHYPLTERDLHNGPVHHSNEGYGASKRIAEIIGRLYSESSTTKFITIYPCNLYGPGDNFNLDSCHVLSGLIAKAHKSASTGEDMVIWGSGQPLRQFLYVEDLARLLVMILDQFNGSSMILCPDQDGGEISISALADVICKIVKKVGGDAIWNVTHDLTKSDGVYRKTVSNATLRETFPYFQFTPLEEGIEQTYAWYTANNNVPAQSPVYTISGNLPGFAGLAGGIGNQLFLIATVLAAAWDSNFKAVFRLDSKHKYRYNNDYRKTLLKQFTFTDEDLDYGIIHQSAIPKDAPVVINSDAILEGYFQSPMYFKRWEDRLRKTLSIDPFEPDVRQAIGNLRNMYTSKRIVGVQVRRGDYASLAWLLPTNYYKEAMASLGKDVAFVISTDDVEWCGTVFPGIPILNCQDWVAFLVLCNLDGIIMSNSTFGWWAAFLGNLQTVIAPDPWFKNNTYDSTLYLDHWTKMGW